MKHTRVLDAVRILFSCIMIISLLGPSLAFAAGKVMYVNTENGGSLNVRSTPDPKGRRLGSLPNGTAVTVLSQEDDWSEITYRQGSAYVRSAFLSAKPPVSPGLKWKKTNQTMYVRTANKQKLHLRRDATRQSESLGLFAPGTAVRVSETSDSWARVTVESKNGYMMLSCLTSEKPAVSSSAKSEPFSAYVRAGAGVTLYAEASGSSRKIVKLPGGTAVKVYSVSGAWASVTVLGRTGYIPSSGLTVDNPVSARQTAEVVNPNGASYVNVRSSPAINGRLNVLTTVKVGRTVQVIGKSKSWYRIICDECVGYIHQRFLQMTD